MEAFENMHALLLAGDLKMKSGDEKIVWNIDKIGEGRDWLSEWHLMKEVTSTFCEGKAAVWGILYAHLIELSAVFEARHDDKEEEEWSNE